MSEQKLHSSEVAGLPVDQHSLRTPERVRAELGRVEPDAGHPFLHEPSILPSSQPARAVILATGKQELSGLPASQSQVLVDGLPRLVR